MTDRQNRLFKAQVKLMIQVLAYTNSLYILGIKLDFHKVSFGNLSGTSTNGSKKSVFNII